MITIYSPLHEQHNPPHELISGRLIPYTESPQRVENIIAALRAANLGPMREPETWDLEPIRRVHEDAYLEHLRTIYARWQAALSNPPATVLPEAFPVHAQMRRRSGNPVGDVGYFAFDMSAPITATSYDAILASAACALTGASLLNEGERVVYALCRPPGHHAAAALMGGFCYLNNAAIAAQYLLDHGAARVALLDIDVHHGNGTQAIFYDRSDVFFISLHGSPEWEYPYYTGYADESGTGAGEGYNLNIPLDQGVNDGAFLAALDGALERIRRYAPDALVLSAGFDTFIDDTMSHLDVTTPAYRTMGERIATLNLPTLVVQEGGYAVDVLGENLVSLLRGLI